MIGAFFTGLAGPELLEPERQFLRASRPAGIILFARNIADPDQVRRLIASAREAIGNGDCLVLVDQEGGRVQRLRPPHWRALPAARKIANFADGGAKAVEAIEQVSRLIAADLRALGFNCNCTPVLDLPVEGSHEVIGDRAFGTSPADVIARGRAVMSGHLAGGVVPVIKHIPGHGRARADSHLELPVVDAARETLEATDFAPFKALADCPAAMTAHVVYSAIDPARPASTSAIVHRDIIRGQIGFDGLLMSDDLSMKALEHFPAKWVPGSPEKMRPSKEAGPMRDRAEAVLRAGSDIALHCNGDGTEMEAVAAGAGALSGKALDRFRRAVAVTHQQTPFNLADAEACLAEVLALSA